MSDKIRVAVLYGGRSAEHEISLISARNVVRGLDTNRYDVVPVAIDRAGHWRLSDTAELLEAAQRSLPVFREESENELHFFPGHERRLQPAGSAGESFGRIDVVFPVLHGPFGEDGSVQGMLKLLDLPFVGPSVAGSAVGMDKVLMKRLLREAGIPIGDFRIATARDRDRIDFHALKKALGLPMYVKPANMGSSVGINRVRSESEWEHAISEAFLYDTKIVIEANIVGREIECAVLGNEDPIASLPGEIVPKDGFYSYRSKYYDEKGAALEIPARLDPDLIRRVKQLSVDTFRALDLEGMSRVDLFLTADAQLLVNEVNTIPGFTNISMYPKLWEVSGIPFPALLDRLIELAFERHARDSALRTDVDIPDES